MGDILYQPEPRKTMNGNNNIPDNSSTDDRCSKDRIDLRKENTEFERRRKLVEDAKKLILNAQKV